MAGVTLKDVKEISTPGAPLKDSLFIALTNIDNWTSGPADSKPTNGDCKYPCPCRAQRAMISRLSIYLCPLCIQPTCHIETHESLPNRRRDQW